jgi:AcrR family transcriptional regulator
MEYDILHRRISIVLTTIDVINEFGIQGFSTREIAKRLGVSEGTIFKHFKTKNELILAVLEHYSQYDFDIMISAKRKENFLDKVMFFIKAFAEYYENYPQITAITQAYDVLAYDPVLGEKIKSISRARVNFMMELLEEGKAEGKVAPDINVEKLTHIIFGSFQSICLKWRLEQNKFSLKEYILSTVDMILKAFIID